MTATDPTPDAPVIDLIVRTIRVVRVHCPYCGQRHRHLWAKGSTTVRTRVSHCRNSRRPYRITVTA